MAPIHALISALVIVLAPLSYTVYDHPVETPDGRTLTHGVGCADGYAEYYRAHEPPPEDDAHEMGHLVDCLDDGLLNGSPGHPRPARWADGLRILSSYGYAWNQAKYCWWGGTPGHDLLPDAEWYACMVVATGDIY